MVEQIKSKFVPCKQVSPFFHSIEQIDEGKIFMVGVLLVQILS